MTLSETAHVRMSADAARYSVAAFYKRRNADDEFREKWDGALVDGRVALKLMLLALARRSMDPGADGPTANGGMRGRRLTLAARSG